MFSDRWDMGNWWGVILSTADSIYTSYAWKNGSCCKVTQYGSFGLGDGLLELPLKTVRSLPRRPISREACEVSVYCWEFIRTDLCIGEIRARTCNIPDRTGCVHFPNRIYGKLKTKDLSVCFQDIHIQSLVGGGLKENTSARLVDQENSYITSLELISCIYYELFFTNTLPLNFTPTPTPDNS